MSFLLDTHALLWALMEPEKLSPKALEAIQNPDNRLFVSSASAWEPSIKYALGKLKGAEAILEGFAGNLQRLQADPSSCLMPWQQELCPGTTVTPLTGCSSPRRNSSVSLLSLATRLLSATMSVCSGSQSW